MDDATASATAVLVCQGRAVAQRNKLSPQFDDPTADVLLTTAERAAVERAAEPSPPRDLGRRLEYEQLRAVADVMVPRTVAIDAVVRASAPGCTQLVIVGAGLDGRAWRMADLAAVDVFEVDHPASQADKRARVGTLDTTARSISFVPIDLARESLTAALRSAGHDPAVATTWIWEGVIPYLTRAHVESSLAHIAACSAPCSTLVANYQSPSLQASLGRVAGAALARLAR
ncbi:MAG TPA: class I SAM-dependent methyltransferase, partial [Ilumatobacteraceae bacterium]